VLLFCLSYRVTLRFTGSTAGHLATGLQTHNNWPPAAQGLGAPACAKLLTQWFSSTERGTAWSIWTASNNVGGFAAPWIAGTAAGAFGWRWGMWVPAICALCIASVIIFTITDKPTDRGFPPVDAAKPAPPQPPARPSGGAPSAAPSEAEASASSSEKAEKEEKAKEEEATSLKDILFRDVLPNPWVWLLAVTYFFVYMVRQGTASWFVHYLMNVKGVSDIAAAAGQVSGLEVGGFFGALSAGARRLSTSHFHYLVFSFAFRAFLRLLASEIGNCYSGHSAGVRSSPLAHVANLHVAWVRPFARSPSQCPSAVARGS
jgi:sugar phosphate permease